MSISRKRLGWRERQDFRVCPHAPSSSRLHSPRTACRSLRTQILPPARTLANGPGRSSWGTRPRLSRVRENRVRGAGLGVTPCGGAVLPMEVPSFPERDRQAVDAPDVLLLVGSEVAPRSHRRAACVGRPLGRVMRTAKCLSVAGAATACRGAAADSPETTCRSRRALRSP